MSLTPESSTPATTPWLVRISVVFSGITEDILASFSASSIKRLANEYYVFKTPNTTSIHTSEAAIFTRWNLPMEHMWPINPQKTEGFIEKAAQALVKKFGDRSPQAIFIGPLNPGSPDPYYKNLASNLRGRVLQVFPKLPISLVESQDPTAKTLFCLVGEEGLYCGMQSPKDCNGFYPGGSKYIANDTPDTISRAGAKIAEALHYMQLYRPLLPPGSHWLELGACPGGMTSELLQRNYQVTAVDVARLDRRLDRHPGLDFHLGNVEEFHPADDDVFHGLLCDMNGDPFQSLAQVVRMSEYLHPDGVVIFTLKVPHVTTVHEPIAMFDSIVSDAERGGLRLFAQTHLTYNRHEFTLFFEHADKKH